MSNGQEYLPTLESYSRAIKRIGKELNTLRATIDRFQVPIPEITSNDILITPKEVASILGISIKTVSIYRDKGHYGAVKLSERKYLYRKKEIIDFLTSSYSPPEKQD